MPQFADYLEPSLSYPGQHITIYAVCNIWEEFNILCTDIKCEVAKVIPLSLQHNIVSVSSVICDTVQIHILKVK